MFLLIILPILVSGFVCCHTHPVFKYKLHRYEGQYLYLKSASLGIICVISATLIVLLANKIVPPKLGVINLNIHQFLLSLIEPLDLFTHKQALQFAWMMMITITSLFIPYLWSLLAYLKYSIRYKTWSPITSINSVILADSPLDNFLYNAFLQKGNQLVMLTLNDKKVYIGKIISLGEPNETEGLDQEIELLPVMSGYRDKDTFKIKLTNFYESSTSHSANIIILRQELISSATQFDIEIFSKHNPAKSQWHPTCPTNASPTTPQ